MDLWRALWVMMILKSDFFFPLLLWTQYFSAACSVFSYSRHLPHVSQMCRVKNSLDYSSQQRSQCNTVQRESPMIHCCSTTAVPEVRATCKKACVVVLFFLMCFSRMDLMSLFTWTHDAGFYITGWWTIYSRGYVSSFSDGNTMTHTILPYLYIILWWSQALCLDSLERDCHCVSLWLVFWNAV